MPWVDDVGWVEDTPPAPASYEEQVAMARSWGVPENQIASVVGTPETVAANNQAQAQAIQEITGSAPSWSQDVGYTAPPPDWLNPADYTANNYAAPYTQQQITGQVDPSWIRQMNGQTYASVKGPSDLSGGEYLVDPNTGRFVLDASGNPVGVTYPKSNNFDDWVTTPLGSLALTFGVPLSAMGGVAALEGLGALGAGAAPLETIGAGGLPGGGAFIPTAGSGASFSIIPGGAYTAAALETIGANGLPGGGPFTPSPGSGANFTVDPNAAYTTSALANAATAAGTGSQLANLLKGGATAAKALTGSSSSGINSALLPALSQLAQGQSGYGMEVPGIVRTNQNPFYNTPQVALQTPQKTETSQIADLLRQGKPSWQT